MVQKRQPIPVPEAVNRVMSDVQALQPETIPINEADGRVLAEDIISDHDVPPFNRSPYDGFAVRAVDTSAASKQQPATLKVIETIGAGQVATKKLTNGEAIRIMTGAQIPEGADAVVMLELAYEASDSGHIWIKRPFNSGDNISFQGEDTEAGELLLKAGRKITPGVIAVLATFGYKNVEVFRQPRVGILATGTELLAIDEPLAPGKIRNSNAYMIAAQVKDSGAIPIHYGSVADDLETSLKMVEHAMSETDVLITTGGVSVGDFDYLPAIYQRLQADVLFNKVGMRPGSVTTVAKAGKKGLFGLSGNPSACFVGFELFIKPYIKALQGDQFPYLNTASAILAEDFPKANPFTRFVRCQMEWDKGTLYAAPVRLDKSNVVTSLAHANGFAVLPGGTRGYQKGMKIDALLLNSAGSKAFAL